MRQALTILVLFSAVACTAAEPVEQSTTLSTEATLPAPTPAEVVSMFDECAATAGATLPPLTLDATGRPDIARLVLTIDPLDPGNRDAFTECAPILAGALPLEGESKSRVTAALAGFAQCMREEGILAFPDPAPGFEGTGDPFELDPVVRQAPGFPEAADLCSSRLAGAAR